MDAHFDAARYGAALRSLALDDAVEEVVFTRWLGRPSSGRKDAEARACVELLGAERLVGTITASDAVEVRVALERKVSIGYARCAYATLREVLSASGVACHDWPDRRRGKPTYASPRAFRPASEVAAIICELDTRGHAATADLGRLVWGMRTELALRAVCEGRASAEDFGDHHRLTIRGSGACTLRVVEGEARSIVGDPERFRRLRWAPENHRSRWRAAAQVVGSSSDHPRDAARLQRTLAENEIVGSAAKVPPPRSAPRVVAARPTVEVVEVASEVHPAPPLERPTLAFPKLHVWLNERGWSAAADRLALEDAIEIAGAVDALIAGRCRVEAFHKHHLLHVPGDPPRVVPVVGYRARNVLDDPERLEAIRGLSVAAYRAQIHEARRAISGS